MLSIIGKKQCEQIEVSVDDYVPLRILCESDRGTPSLYWRTGNMKSTLLEVEISPVDGQIIGVSLLLPGEIGSTLRLHDTPDAMSGIPLVRFHEWPDGGFLDDPGALRVFVDGSSLLILIGDSIASRSLAACNVVFGISVDTSLAWIRVDNLSFEALRMFA